MHKAVYAYSLSVIVSNHCDSKAFLYVRVEAQGSSSAISLLALLFDFF
jgi:hypothetical protein